MQDEAWLPVSNVLSSQVVGLILWEVTPSAEGRQPEHPTEAGCTRASRLGLGSCTAMAPNACEHAGGPGHHRVACVVCGLSGDAQPRGGDRLLDRPRVLLCVCRCQERALGLLRRNQQPKGQNGTLRLQSPWLPALCMEVSAVARVLGCSGCSVVCHRAGSLVPRQGKRQSADGLSSSATHQWRETCRPGAG